MMMGLSTSVSKSSARKLLVAPATGISGVCTPFQAAGNSTFTSCGRLPPSGSVTNVGAPFSMAKPASTQLLRTVISRL